MLIREIIIMTLLGKYLFVEIRKLKYKSKHTLIMSLVRLIKLYMTTLV